MGETSIQHVSQIFRIGLVLYRFTVHSETELVICLVAAQMEDAVDGLLYVARMTCHGDDAPNPRTNSN